MGSSTDFDVIVVGAGPAGSAAAMTLARAGRSVCLLERGPFPGSKNMYGGVIYGRVLDTLIPDWYEQAPIQRWVTRRGTMLLTDHQSLCIDYRTTAWGEAPYNGATAYRADFDNWFADQAVGAGATLVCSTTATGLVRTSRGLVGGVEHERIAGYSTGPSWHRTPLYELVGGLGIPISPKLTFQIFALISYAPFYGFFDGGDFIMTTRLGVGLRF